MKKSYILLFVVTLTACNNDKTLENPKEEVKELVPVDSLVIKDVNGNDVVVTEETPFYDLLDLLNIRKI